MFVVTTATEEIKESSVHDWRSLPGELTGAYLLHPVFKISIGLHGCKRYAFCCEGAAALQLRCNFKRIAEHLYGDRGDGTYLHLVLHRNGTISSFVSNSEPDIDRSIWKGEESIG